MSAIGDYIHYSKTTYETYGINRDTIPSGNSAYSKASQVFNSQKEKMKRSILKPKVSDEELENLSTFLTNFIYASNNLSEEDKELYKKWKALLDEEFGIAYSKFGYGDHLGIYQRKEPVKVKEGTSRRNALKYLEKLQNLLKKKDLDDASISQLKTTIDGLEIEIKKMGSKGKLTNNNHIIDEINKCLILDTLPYKQATGDVFEQGLGILSLLMDKTADEKVPVLLDNVVKGSARSDVKLYQKNFSKDFVNLNTILNKEHQLDENNSYTYGYTQDKLDVIFKWKGNNLRVSAKNYKLEDSSQKIHLVSGTSLLYLLQNENPVFVNHWLNAISVKNRDSDLMKAAHDAARVTILVKALTGQGLGRTKSHTSNTFIVNARSHKKVYVLSMKKLLDNCIEILDNNGAGISFGDYPMSGVAQKWEGSKDILSESDAKTRITNLLSTIHSKKIKVSLHPSLLNNK